MYLSPYIVRLIELRGMGLEGVCGIYGGEKRYI